ncbi:MAG: hypothetical protein IKO03_03045 [Lachnospiraceae bacterium]|nr:hypothetical protein [Lachnospiraceae bacterium]MBR4608477.1 hypothetical protein [Lachnospiraceae bacterium]
MSFLGKTYYHAGELRECNLWSEEQQKCVHYVISRSGKRIHQDVQGDAGQSMEL